MVLGFEDLLVYNLLDSEGQWNYHLLCRLFSPSDVQKIMRIPISTCDLADELVWHHTKDENFSVRSAYRVILRSFKVNLLSFPSNAYIFYPNSRIN